MHMRVRLAAYVCVYVRCRYAPNVHVLPALKQRWGKDQPTPAESMPDNLSTLTVAALKKELKARMLPVSGVKTELVNRLQDSLDGVERPKRKRRTMSFSPFDGHDHQSTYQSDSSSGSGDDYGPILPLSMPPVPAKLGVRVVKSGQPLSWAQRQHMFDRPAKHAKQLLLLPPPHEVLPAVACRRRAAVVLLQRKRAARRAVALAARVPAPATRSDPTHARSACSSIHRWVFLDTKGSGW